MGTMRFTEVADLAITLRDKFGIKTLVETGTFMGESTSWAAENFERVITIDISEEYQNQAKVRCEQYNNILYLLGDSRVALPPAVRALPPGPAMFWLDGHNARQYFGPGPDDCPVLEELDAVLTADEGHIILIDDASCYIPPVPHDPAVWPEISVIKDVADKFGYILRVAHDVIAITPPAATLELNKFGGDENLCAAIIDPEKLRQLQRKFKLHEQVHCAASAVIGDPDVPDPTNACPQITEIVESAYGRMLVPLHDTNQTPALRAGGGGLDSKTINLFRKLMQEKPNGVFLDVGANVGTYTCGLHSHCVQIHAFEPQRIIYNMLCGTVALNGWTNVYCHNLAVSDSVGSIPAPQYDYTQSMSFGSIELGEEQREELSQARPTDPALIETVMTTTIDYCDFERVDFMKIDVEGMELKVLVGAEETLKRCYPVIYIEHGKSDKEALHSFLLKLNYDVEDTGNDYFCRFTGE